MDVQPYKINISDQTLQDLKDRLSRTRWPDEIPGSEWDYGANLSYMKEFVEYWRDSYDWRAQERALNAFSNYRANLDGLGIHFIHERGKGPNPMPIVVTHGWPGSVFEMSKLIPLLSDPGSHGGDPADAFDVVAPSLPGYGFSDPPMERGFNTNRVADLWVKLMEEGLGYTRFAAHGGDWGSIITTRMGYAHPKQVLGIHTTSVSGTPNPGPGDPPLTEAEKDTFAQRDSWWQREAGYAHLQMTKPQTIGYALNDSPVGLAAWLVDKFRMWSDCGGDVESVYTKDELLTNIMFYWATDRFPSSARFYLESLNDRWTVPSGERIEVPCAFAIFPKEHSRPPREWAERAHNVQRWTVMPRGGHFSSLEQPQLMAEDIRAFFRTLR